MGNFIWIFLWFGIIGFSKSQECIVKDKKTNAEKHCSFPFILDGKIYYGCTDNLDETNNLACSTKTDSLSYDITGPTYAFVYEKLISANYGKIRFLLLVER